MASFKEVQNGSLRYITDNKKEVTRSNQKTLVILNIFYTAVLASYLVASLTVFRAWNVTALYTAATSVQIVLLVLTLLRYNSNQRRNWKEVKGACTFFQLYAMLFVGIMSIVPVEMNQPAVYLAPIAMGFAATFVFELYYGIILLTVEMGVYLVIAFIFKDPGVFAVDCCSSLLAILMGAFLAKILYTQRMRENDTRQHIKRMGMVDTLTGLYNKASTEFLCKNYLHTKTNRPCAMMILDFDNFKFVNDTYGHQAGDAVLRSFGRILKSEAGEEHIAGRIGGDEFFLFLKDCGPQEAEAHAERILNKTRMITAKDGTRPFSCSIGIAVKGTNEGSSSASETYRDIFSRADEVLYQVKENGKNNYMTQS